MTDPFESQAQARSGDVRFALSDPDIQVWWAVLDDFRADLSHPLDLLSADEKARAARFYFERDRSRYIIGRGLLRLLLGSYLGSNPAEIKFEYGLYGKPALAPQAGGRRLEFNLSHSNEMAVYIFNWDHPLGIDIEYIQPLKDMDDFALQFFTPAECKLIRSLPMPEKTETFFKLWTSKEAYLKANGSGLSMPLDQVEVVFAGGETGTLTFKDGGLQQAGSWHVQLFTPRSGYQAALATERQDGQIIQRQLPDHFMF